MSSTPHVPSVKLKGHQGAVLCLDHSSSLSKGDPARFNDNMSSNPPAVATACLLSGSEDGTARLWDLRERSDLRAAL